MMNSSGDKLQQLKAGVKISEPLSASIIRKLSLMETIKVSETLLLRGLYPVASIATDFLGICQLQLIYFFLK
jgi:hypothetical protein